MDIAAIFMRPLDTNGAVYAPYTIEGATDEERDVIENALRPNVPEKVDAGFNNWHISKIGGAFYARRATWEHGTGAATAVEMAERIASYYARSA